MVKLNKEEVFEILDRQMGKVLPCIDEKNNFCDGGIWSAYILRVNDHLKDAAIVDVEDLPEAVRQTLDDNDLGEAYWTALCLTFDDGATDTLFYDDK